jgi:hypothetical protein
VNTDLAHTIVFAHGFNHMAAFGNTKRKRFFDVDVFARLASLDGLQGMPVIWCGNNDGVQVFLVKKLAVILKLPWRRARLFRGEIHVRLREITNSRDFGIRLFEKSVEDLVAAVA